LDKEGKKMSIAAINSIYTDSAQTSQSSKSSISLDDFYTLLITELKNQDPTDPLDNRELLQQVASFKQLDDLNAISTNIETMLSSVNSSSAVSYIGKTVVTSGNEFTVSEGASGTIRFDLAGDASDVTVSIYNSDGNLVRTIDEGALSQGEHAVEWDTCDNEGNKLSDGTYTFSVSAVDNSGNAVSSTTLTTSVVSGVSFEDGVAYLKLGNESVPVASVVEVYDS
jgi:flagellar basal-body rod modification protein FlgD